MKRLIWMLMSMIVLATPVLADDIAITIYYGGHQMTFVGPSDDVFCTARSTGLKFKAERIQVPAGNYQLLCPEIVYDPKFRWVTPEQEIASPKK